MKKTKGKIASGKHGKRQAVDRSLHPVVRLLKCREIIRDGDEMIHTEDWPCYCGRERWVPVDPKYLGERYSFRGYPPMRRPNPKVLPLAGLGASREQPVVGGPNE